MARRCLLTRVASKDNSGGKQFSGGGWGEEVAGLRVLFWLSKWKIIDRSALRGNADLSS